MANPMMGDINRINGFNQGMGGFSAVRSPMPRPQPIARPTPMRAPALPNLMGAATRFIGKFIRK